MLEKLCALLCILLLLACFTQPKPHDELPLRSMGMRDPNIDAVWYKGRGIRPVGRFGRRMAERDKLFTDSFAWSLQCVETLLLLLPSVQINACSYDIDGQIRLTNNNLKCEKQTHPRHIQHLVMSVHKAPLSIQ
ncbi:LOW QUALITY PROTEIN: prolactin-releasing peptide [Siphateles boraxobius]|uniref:LOW QUALITY PROTEIN: prolactin-releasing peptide n=1 Tax=Siphateles boraxobius TaxID=180520 RepID=UPI0040642299